MIAQGSADEDERYRVLSSEELPSDDSCLDSGSDDDEEDQDEVTNLTLERSGTTWCWKQTDEKLEPSLEENLRKRRQHGKATNATIEQRRSKSDDGIAAKHFQATRENNGKVSSTSKHAPKEVSSKREDFYIRDKSLGSSGVNFEAAGVANKYKPRDPRIDSSGQYNQETYDKDYEFLNDIMKQEIETLQRHIAVKKMTGSKGRKARKKLSPTTAEGSVSDDQLELKRLKEHLLQRQRAAAQHTAKVVVKRNMDTDIAEGKRGVYYLKRTERRKLELEATFEELRKRGGDKAVDKALAKRRKKNASKDHKHMPRIENSAKDNSFH